MAYQRYHPPHHPELLTHKAAKEAMDELATLLKEGQPITINEIIKAGSLGHGTAVPGDFDLDLVIYSRDVDAHWVLQNGYDQWLELLEDFLQRNRKVELKRRTPNAVQFKYNGIIDVDLLVSPWWDDVHQLSRFLNKVPTDQRFKFSVCASKWQVEFMKKQPEQVKELIQRAKAWRNKQWPKSCPGQKKPKSYFLSLLVLKAYERVSKSSTDIRDIATKTTRELKTLILRQNQEDIYWENYYSIGRYGNTILENPPQRPRLLDPANPANNLFDTGFTNSRANDRSHDYDKGDGDWTELKRKIETIDLTESI